MNETHFFLNTRGKQFVVVFLVICVLIPAVYFLVEKNVNEKKLSEKKELVTSIIPAISQDDLAALISRDIYTGYGAFGENTSVLPDILRLSRTGLTPYLYPNGPVCGYGVSYPGIIEIDLFDEMPVNRTTTDEIYHVIDASGRALHQQNTPVLFIRTPLPARDSGNSTYRQDEGVRP